jgi:ABC-type antimicrobial peptide transport system permease subunit
MKPETKGAALVLGLSVIWKTLLLLTGWVDGFLGKYPLLPILGFLLIAMYRTMEERRKLSYSAGVPFKEAFRSGMSVAALFSLTYSLFIYIYLFFLDPQFKVRFVEQRVADMVAQNTPKADIDAWRLSTAEFPFEMSWLVFTFIGVLVLGVFYAAMMARMMARKYPLAKA